MGPKDDMSAKGAEIGEGLIESLGFEPAEGRKSGRNAVAEMSDQLSEAGFAVKEALDDASDAVDASDDSGEHGGDTEPESTNGSSSDSVPASGNGSDADEDSHAGEVDASAVDASDPDVDASESGADSSTDASHAGPSGANGSGRSATTSASSPSAAAAAATAAVAAKLGQAAKSKVGSMRDSVAGSSRADDFDSATFVPVTPGDHPPTSPPTADTTVGSPTAPAVTGEIPRVDAPAEASPSPAVVEQQRPVVVDNRTIVDRPKSVTDLFSGGITGRRRLQARKVRRVIRHIDPWSVLTFSVMFHLCLFAALLLASALVFNVAEEAGTIENLESFIRELGDYETFEIDGQAIFKAAVAIAGIMTLAASVLVVLLTVMFNLLSDLLGGVRITVIEEETVRVKPKNSDAE